MNLPTVTKWGPMMRNCHSAAIMKVCGAGELVANDVDGYVALAVRMGNDPVFREAMRAKIAAGKERLYDDQEIVNAFAAFLEGAVAQTRDGA